VSKSQAKFIIIDWAGNVCFNGRTFKTWDDAEEYLCIKLDHDYETDRQEYYIETAGAE
jgi:hypothetical protein